MWEGRGERCQCAGVTSVSKQPGAQACVFDLASAKLARALFHGQHVAHGINTRKWCFNSPVASRKEQYYSPESHLHSLTQTLLLARTWCTKKPFTDTQVNAVVLSSTFPCRGPRKEHLSTVVWLAWLQHRVSFSDTQLLPLIHPNHPPTLGCTLMSIILMFLMHTHMQTQAKKKKKKKKKNPTHFRTQTQTKAKAGTHQNTQTTALQDLFV